MTAKEIYYYATKQLGADLEVSVKGTQYVGKFSSIQSDLDKSFHTNIWDFVVNETTMAITGAEIDGIKTL